MTADTMTATSETVELPTGPIHVVSGGDGPPLLLLHHDVGPFGWGELEERLAQRFRVVVPDLPGFGESPRCEWARHPRDLAALMLALTRAMPLRAYTLVGLGFGGWVAAEMAVAAYPGMHAIVLAAPAGLKPEEAFIRDQIMEEHTAYLKAGFADDAGFAAVFPDPADRSLRPRLESARETIARLTWKPYMYSYELAETLGNVQAPVTVVWGEGDQVIPASCARQWAAALPNCESRSLPTSAHFLDREEPAALAEIIIAAAAPKAG